MGTSKVIFGYNGRDGVVTDDNGLIYMRARYYSPVMKRFINADIVAGEISNAVTLNRFAYANGNPISFVDPFDLSALDWARDKYNQTKTWARNAYNNAKNFVVDTYNDAKQVVIDTYNEVKDWVVDTYNVAKERVINTYNEVKDFVVDKYDAKDWVNEKIVQPVTTMVNNVKEDIQNYDKNNTDVEKVYKSHYFSSYNGAIVIRHSIPEITSWGIGNIIFLNHDQDPKENQLITQEHIDYLNHEYGHLKQYNELGFNKYILFVAIPSMTYNVISRGNELNYYYDFMPWEYDANARMGIYKDDEPSWAASQHERYFNFVRNFDINNRDFSPSRLLNLF